VRAQEATPVEATRLPDDESLREALVHALAGEVEIVERGRLGHRATFPNEVLTVLVNRKALRLFCKYDAPHERNDYHHRGGVAYEAAVYRNVLSRLSLPHPACYGEYEDHPTGTRWLFLEHLEGTLPYTWVESKDSLLAAARWIGRFHAATAPEGAAFGFLNGYDHGYYRGWLERAQRLAAPTGDLHPWLGPVAARFEEAAEALLEAPRSVIHGEYYAGNVLYRDGEVYPVDWESAAVAGGEIDLAMILDRSWKNDRWSGDDFAEAVTQYRRARWPEREPPGFERRLAAAKLYVQVRWLGDPAVWTVGQTASWRFDAARDAAVELGLL
jgi:aminoglycoside phosphotransferase (APT) family kinase protein